MSKITRYSGNVVPFANNAQAGERFVFGSSTEQSNDLTTLVTANYLRGWGVVGPSDFPPLEWFNAQAFTSTQFIAYLHQMGISEWDGEQEYHENSVVNRNGVLYYCKTNDHVSVTPPESDPTNWRKPRAQDAEYDNAASGLAATDVQGAIDEVQAYTGGQVIATGSAVFTNSTNNIALTGIGIGVEIGDVITISGATNAKNNSEFTVEVITNDNNIIVNQAHAGGTTTKSLVSETATVTVKLLCKWYLASDSLGRGIAPVPLPLSNEILNNNTGRGFQIYARVGESSSISVMIDGELLAGPISFTSVASAMTITIPRGSEYRFIYTGNFTTYYHIR